MPPMVMLEDANAQPMYQTPGDLSIPHSAARELPNTPRQVTLRDRITTATLLPISTASQVPPVLLEYLKEQLNKEIEVGDTYPMYHPLTLVDFASYWFQSFAAIMIMGSVDSVAALAEMQSEGADWSKLCLGSFYVKQNFEGRSGHICTGGFLVTDAARNKGVGRLMGEGYLDWAPRLGYTYSVFNLVYETNVASCRIWDALGFKRVGRIKGAGALKSHPDEWIDAIIYGRDLGPEGEDFVSEERFDKIRYYLKHSKYPAGADRAEKSRLRSAATHYKLMPNSDGSEERLMLKDKEVVADPQQQYEIARQLHAQTHGGINKTTASIAERYHWVRIKETVSLVIKNCPECKESPKAQNPRPDGQTNSAPGNGRKSQVANNANSSSHDPNREIERLVKLDQTNNIAHNIQPPMQENIQPRRPRKSIPKQEPDLNMNPQHDALSQQALQQQSLQQHPMAQHQASIAQMHQLRYDELPLDPQIMSYAAHGLAGDPMAHALDHHNLSHQGLGSDHGMSHQGLTSDHNMGAHPSLASDHTLSAHQGLANNHDMSTHQGLTDGHSITAHQNLNGINLAHGLPDASTVQAHNVDQNMTHVVGHHGNMHMNMGVMGHSSYDMGLGPPNPGHQPGMNIGVGADDRMDTDADEVGEGGLGHHLIEAGFGSSHSGN